MHLSFLTQYKEEFSHYSAGDLRQDVLAGITVAAVALPLALAFGVASGTSASAGMVTAILAGLVIGLLSGAPYQISGPTGAMSAVLILLVQKYGLEGIWLAGLLAGLFLLILGVLRLGRFIAFIPGPVITGFTSGIALIIAIGQIDNFLGIKTAGAESSALKLLGYFHGGYAPDWRSLLLGLAVILIMIFWPKNWNRYFPASLLAIILTTAFAALAKWSVPAIGAIPQSIILSDHLRLTDLSLATLQELINPALTIAALGAIESLLCGTVASNMTGIRLNADQELIAQGVGNMLIPFFGGVPATAAIARTSVGIKSGGKTRVVSLVHALVLLASMAILAPIMAQIPLSALAGVLIVTAWRMNEWENIRYIFSRRFKTAIFTFLVTLAATVSLDLTQAILIGVFLSGLVYLNQSAAIHIQFKPVDPDKILERGIHLAQSELEKVTVAYLSGPLFFAATGHFTEAFSKIPTDATLILSMRGVPLVDTSGLQALQELQQKLNNGGGKLMITSLQPAVEKMLLRSGLADAVGEQNIFWSAELAIQAAAQSSIQAI